MKALPALAAVLAGHAAAQGLAARITTVSAPPRSTVQQVFFADVSGDGEPDLIVATADDDRPEQRTLRVHHFRGSGAAAAFDQRPDEVVTVPRTVTVATDTALTGLFGPGSRRPDEYYLRSAARLMELAIRDTRERVAREER